ncbi:MAG TPA: lipopolysaccharide heptosyltransferase II [Lacipirellulaceae bacterium]|jgi:heptosyltransferase-2|nr:lipopolysaccharide heptosyltransferase II [Lacipirellulaceae bacterium]
MRLGVFLPNWVGDVVMATPALRALRQLAGADGQLVGIMRPYVSEVLAGTTWLDESIVYDKSRKLSPANRNVYAELRSARLDTVVLLTNSLRTAWMAWRSGARERIGYRNDARSLLLTKRIRQPLTPDGRPLPTAESYLHLASVAGCAAEPARLELATTAEDERAADAVWAQLNLPAGDRVVVLNSGGAFGAAKLWPAEYFAELARRIVAGGRFSVLVNCGPSERELARFIAAEAKDPRVVSLAGIEDLPVGLTKACIRRSRLLVTTDSGPRYFGVAFEKPVVTLFGPTDPLRTQLPYDRERSLSLSLDCQPCMKRVCPLGHHRCMRDLSVDMVYAATNRLLEFSPAEQVA